MTVATAVLGAILAGSSVGPVTHPLDPTDRAILEAAVAHALTHGDFYLREGVKRNVAVVDAVIPNTGLDIPCAAGCIEEGHTLPNWAMSALVQRNARLATQWDYVCSPCAANILVVTDLDGMLLAAMEPSHREYAQWFTGSLSTFERAFPTAAGWLRPYLPAYSPGGDEAVLRAWLGPSPHGSLLTAHLRREGTSWRVLWLDVVHFA